MPKLTLPRKVILLFFLSIVPAAIGIIFCERMEIFLPAILIVFLNFGFAVKMLLSAMKDFNEALAVIRKISYGDYSAKIDASRNKELEVVDVMAKKLKDHDIHLSQRAYQTTMLKELAERISTSLDARDAMEIISGSLSKVVSYSTVSYIAFEKDQKIIFKCHLEESISRAFTEEVRKKMLDAFRTLTSAPIADEDVKTIYYGTIFDETARDPIRSFFNLPMIIGGQLVGLINVASTKPGLYAEQEVAILYVIAEQASSTITKIRAILAEEMGKINSMLAAVNQGLIMVAREGDLLVINKEAKRFLGIPDRENISTFDIIHALYGLFDFRGAMDQVLNSGKTETFPKLKIKETYYKISASPVINGRGEKHAVVFVLSDITQEQEIDEMKSEFISTTSHQLRTPLSSMKWFLEMMINGDTGALNDKQKEVVTDVYNSNERIIALVNDLLDVSRIESGKMLSEPTPTNLIEFINSMLVDSKAQFAKRNQEFSFEHPDSLPRVLMDPKMTWQTLQNLLSNAAKYTPEKGKITLSLSLEGENIIIKVADNGLGIPEFQKHRLFEKFFRADNVNKSDGTGLGLYISRKIAEAGGGKLWFESIEGKGSTFYFTIPVAGNKNTKVEQ